MSTIRWATPLLTLSMLTIAAAGARIGYAQTERSGSGGVNAQLYQDYQQAVSDRTRLRNENEKLKSDLNSATRQAGELKKQLAVAQAGAAGSQAQIAAAQTGQANATKNLETLRANAQQLVERFRQTIATLKGVELERTQLQRDLAQTKVSLDRCTLANYDLYQVDNEVLNRYQHQGAFSYLARSEPFTRIERTRIENAVLEYRARAEALRVPPRAAIAPASAAPSAAGTATATPPTTPTGTGNPQ
jgi:chromosome segregation ATPase